MVPSVLHWVGSHNVSDAALEYEMQNHFGAVIDVKKDISPYKNKRYEMESRSFIITELYEHLPRSHRIFNRWCLVYYTGWAVTLGEKTK